MAVKTIKVTILLRRDTLKNWETINPILKSGERSYVTDIGKCKIGDGETEWKKLPYFALETDYDDTASIIIKSAQTWPDYDRTISNLGTVYVYTYEDASPKIRIGDGKAYICDLPFTTDTLSNKIDNHINNQTIHITQEQRQLWNDKVTAYIHPQDSDHLILDDVTLNF